MSGKRSVTKVVEDDATWLVVSDERWGEFRLRLRRQLVFAVWGSGSFTMLESDGRHDLAVEVDLTTLQARAFGLRGRERFLVNEWPLEVQPGLSTG
jgi:hypothetical protein